MKTSIALAALLALSPVSALAEKTAYVGSFYILLDKDPIDDSATVVALATNKANEGIAFRCVAGKLAIVVIPDNGTYTVGDTFDVKLRGDNQRAFIEETATAFTTSALGIDTDVDAIFDTMSGAKSIAVRVAGAVNVFTYTVPILQSAKVLEQVKKACPNDNGKKSADEKGEN